MRSVLLATNNSLMVRSPRERASRTMRSPLRRQHHFAGDLGAARGHEVESQVMGEILRVARRLRQDAVLGGFPGEVVGGAGAGVDRAVLQARHQVVVARPSSEEHTPELQSLMRIPY